MVSKNPILQSTSTVSYTIDDNPRLRVLIQVPLPLPNIGLLDKGSIIDYVNFTISYYSLRTISIDNFDLINYSFSKVTHMTVCNPE